MLVYILRKCLCQIEPLLQSNYNVQGVFSFIKLYDFKCTFMGNITLH